MLRGPCLHIRRLNPMMRALLRAKCFFAETAGR